MWSGLLSAALLYGVLSTTIVVAQTVNPTPPFGVSPTGPPDVGADTQVSRVPAPSSTSQSTGSGGSDKGTDGSSGGVSSAIPAKGSAPPGSAPSSSSSSSPGKSNTGAIAGGVVGGVVLLILVGALIFFLRKRKRTRDPLGSMEKTADERAANNESPSPPLPAPIATTSSSPHPHHSPTAPNEGLALMSHYGDAQPQHIPQEVQPVIMPKPYDVNPSSREILDGDEDLDGVSINSPSPVTTPSPERQQEQQRSVPRLPIYQGGKGDTGGNTPPPAL